MNTPLPAASLAPATLLSGGEQRSHERGVRDPLHYLSLGAGVQSSTAALMAALGEIEPMPAAAHFADTKAEPMTVYQWLDWLETQLPFPVNRLTKGSLERHVLAMRTTRDGRTFSKSDIPFFTLNHDGTLGKIVNRGCTRDFKIHPIIAKVKRLVGDKALREWRTKHRAELKLLSAHKTAMRVAANAAKKHLPMPPVPPYPTEAWKSCQDDALVVQWIGISLDEISRMKPSRVPWIRNRWPLIELEFTRHDCLRWLELKGYPRPPRSACYFCPFHNDDEWRRLRADEPKEFAKAVRFERKLQEAKAKSQNFDTKPFLHRSCKPLDEVDFSTAEERGQGNLNLFQNECEGMCGN